MDAVSRRSFIHRALMAGAGATLTVPFASGEFGAEANAQQVGPISDVDPGFVAGRVVDTSPAGAIVEDYDGQLRRLEYAPTTNVWKRARWNDADLFEGDCVYARGELGEENEIIVDRTWANIENLPGNVHDVRQKEIILRLSNDDLVPIRILDETRVERPNGKFQKGDATGLRSGDFVRVISFRESPLSAATIFLANVPSIPADVLDLEDLPDVDIIGTGSCAAYKGLTTWFCCGNVSGCGRCTSSGSGACAPYNLPCRSDRQHMAWAKIVKPDGGRCGPYASGCSVGEDWPRLACDVGISIRNPCTDRYTTAFIRDCGPTVHCETPSGCRDFRKVKFDLTPCAYSAVGNLDGGFMRIYARLGCPS